MSIPILSTPPTTPQRLTDTPAEFVTNMDAWLTYEAGLSAELNAFGAGLQATVSGVDFNGTSTTSLAIGTGTKSFTASTGKLWNAGQWVIAASASGLTNYMVGQVTSYNSGTGALVLEVPTGGTGGSGTKTDWVLSMTDAPTSLPKSGGTMTGALTTATPASGQEALIVPHGAAPSAPTNGSIWSTVAGWFNQLNGATHEFVLRTLAQTLTNKTIALGSNTVSGSLAEFNAALTGDDFVSLTGSETLTNKTVTDPILVGTLRHDIYAIADGAGFAIDPRNGDLQTITLGANRTPTVANFNAGDMVELLIDDGTGFTIDWSTIAVTWIGGSAPSLRASGYTKVRLYKISTTYYGEEVAPPVQTYGISYVGGLTAKGAINGATTPTISLSGLTGGTGGSPSSGDLVVVALAVSMASDLDLQMSSAGWTENQDIYANNAGGADTNLAVYWKIMGGTPDTSFQLSIPSVSNDSYAVAVQVFRGVDQTTPIDVASTTATGTTSVLVDPPAANTPSSGSNCLVLIGGGAHTAGTQTFTASYLTNFLTTGQDNTTRDVTVGMGYLKNIISAYNGAAWTFSTTDNAAYSYASVALVLRAA